jgi:hypothetical protein
MIKAYGGNPRACFNQTRLRLLGSKSIFISSERWKAPMGEAENPSGRRPEKPLAKPVGDLYLDIPPITDPEGSRRPGVRRLASITAFILAISFVIYLFRFPITSVISPKLYAENAWSNTQRSLAKELLAMAGRNSVIKRAMSILGESSAQRLELGDVAYELDNDTRSNKIQFSIERPSGVLTLHLSNYEAGIRLNDDIYSFKPDKPEDEITSLIQANGLALQAPKGLDISYSAFKQAFKTGDVSKVSPDLGTIANRYLSLLGELHEKASYKNAPSEHLRLGDKEVSCKTIMMLISRDDVEDWLYSLADAIEGDAELYNMVGVLAYDWADAIRDQALFYNGSLRITLSSHNNSFVKATMENLESGTSLTASTLGKDYRLDAISIASEGKKKFSLLAIGNHIGPGDFRTSIHASSVGPLSKLDSASVVWQPNAASSNLILGKSGRILKKMTFAVSKDSVVMKPAEEYEGFSYSLSPLLDRPEWPGNAKELSSLKFEDLFEFLE